MFVFSWSKYLHVNRNISCVRKFLRGKITTNRLYCTQTLKTPLHTDEDTIAFRATLPQFVYESGEVARKFEGSLAASWFGRCAQYNLIEKLPYRGQMTLIAYKALVDECQKTPENLDLVRYVAWCSKLMEGALAISDDVSDATTVRMSVPSWHTLKDVNNQYINDALLLATGSFAVLENRLGKKKYYTKLVKAFAQGSFSCLLGQTSDYLLSKENVANHTWEQYNRIVELKAGYFISYLPFELALHMAGREDPGIFANSKEILIPLGRLWQMRNDCYDWTRAAKDIGATDIPENKLSWLSLSAMDRANDTQRKTMVECYGKQDPEKVKRVESLYSELELDQLFLETEKQKYDNIIMLIDKSPYEELKPVFKLFLDYVMELFSYEEDI